VAHNHETASGILAPATKIVIMAQGEQRRLAALGHPKHLLMVGGELILWRTVRLVREFLGADVAITVIGLPAHAASCALLNVELVTLEDPGFCVLDGMLAAQKHWGRDRDRTLVILGDVVFSRQALRAIVTDTRPLVFAGTTDVSRSLGEIFATSFVDRQDMLDALATCPCRVGHNGRRTVHYPRAQGGHLRRLLWWAMERRQLRPIVQQHTWHPDLFQPVDDWTDDIDTPGDLTRLPELESHVRSDAR